MAKTQSKRIERDEIDHYNVDEFSESRSDLTAFVILLRYAKGHYVYLFGSILLIMAASAFLMLSAKTLGSLTESLMAKEPMSALAGKAVAILVFETLNVLLTYGGRRGLAAVTNRIAYQIRLDLFRKISVLPISYFDRQPLGRTITRLTNDVDGIEKFFSGPLARVLSSVITIVSVLTAMLVTNIQLGAVVVAASIPAILVTILSRAPVRYWLREHKIRSSAINAKLAEFINGFPIIKIFALEQWTSETFDNMARRQRDAGMALLTWNSVIRPTAAFFCSFPILAILWWGGQEVLAGTLSVGLIVAFVRYAERFYWPVMAISQEIHVIQEAIASSERIRQMLLEKEEHEVLGMEGAARHKIAGNVEFNNVSMSYVENRPVLRGVSFKIRKGMNVGLVGETGSGKTSTISLLPMLYPLLGGDISIDGVTLKEWNRDHLRRQIGMVSQDIVIFRGTLRENLTIAATESHNLDDARLKEFCEKTGLAQILHRFPQGFDTPLIDGGENLSVGERQLIAFTRMLVRDPAIFILDEATANIDEECERLVQRAIDELLKDRTCFVIAHRLNTILRCDKILVFDKGKIIEEGTHPELMARQGRYSSLAKTQLDAQAIQVSP